MWWTKEKCAPWCKLASRHHLENNVPPCVARKSADLRLRSNSSQSISIYVHIALLSCIFMLRLWSFHIVIRKLPGVPSLLRPTCPEHCSIAEQDFSIVAPPTKLDYSNYVQYFYSSHLIHLVRKLNYFMTIHVLYAC